MKRCLVPVRRFAEVPVLQIDPEFRSLIPPLRPDELAALEASLLAEGCRDALITWQGVLLDGHNRHDLCELHDLDYETSAIEMGSRLEAMIWMLTNQGARRNLTDDQRAMLADDLRERLSKVVAGDLTMREARAEIRKDDRAAKVDRLVSEAMPLSAMEDRLYPVILADPPWRYEHVKTENRAIENHYPTMSLDEIKALDVAALATDDAVLYLWTTSPKLSESLEVLEAWGFRYRTCMVWVKSRIGMGYWARQRHELLLIAVKGAPPTPEPANRPDSVIDAPTTKHSAKPVEAYEIIEKAFPGLPKLELFCRKARSGWTVWGFEAGT